MSQIRSFRVITLFIAGACSTGRPVFAQWTGGPAGPLYYNGGFIGIGTANPLAPIHVASPSTTTLLITNSSPPSASSGGVIYTELTSPPTAADQRLGVFVFGENDGTYRNSIALSGYSSQAWTPGLAQGSYLTFQVTPNGSASRSEALRIDQNGHIGIGTTAPQYLLSVNGTVGAKQVIVTNVGWSDYVFDKDYRPMPLTDLELYIRREHHLPGIPSKVEVEQQGVSLGDMDAKLLAKVEELTLHTIELEKQVKNASDLAMRLQSENLDIKRQLALRRCGSLKPKLARK